MANSDKNITITPNRNLSGQPQVAFTGFGNVPITLKVLDDSNGTLSFEGSSGQLFSIDNNLTSGSIFSVNDVSGIPSIDVNANGTVSIAGFNGNVGVGNTSPSNKLDVTGNFRATGSIICGSATLTTSGSAPIFAARAWVNFNAVADNINSSGNVSSITDEGTGAYQINFTTALPDANYSVAGMSTQGSAGAALIINLRNGGTFSTSAVDIDVKNASSTGIENGKICVVVFM